MKRPELREDPLLDRHVIISQQRASRPHAFTQALEPAANARATCPFCAGREGETPPPTLVIGPPQAWRLRVVPNKYPALLEPEETRADGALTVPDGSNTSPLGDHKPATVKPVSELFESRVGSGAQEVVIPTPDHLTRLGELPLENLRDLLNAYRQRLQVWRARRYLYAQVFQNVGRCAGASLEHLHSQIVVLPLVPVHVVAEIEAARDYYNRHGRTAFADIIDLELADGSRFLAASDGFAAFCPFASRFPYEMRILPRQSQARFEEIDDAELAELAELLHRVSHALERTLPHPSYNWVLHTTPFDTNNDPHYHWRMDFLPRITNLAGFELTTGYYMNPVSPEAAAAALRDRLPKSQIP